MLYELSKAAHLVSLFVWIGGMVAVALALRFPSRPHMTKLRTYDRAVTSPAMISAFAFGILLGGLGGWFSSGWLAVKILLVLCLAGLHGALSGRLRRATKDQTIEPTSNGRYFLPVGFALVVAIVLLVTLKP